MRNKMFLLMLLFLLCAIFAMGQDIGKYQDIFKYPINTENLQEYYAVCRELAGHDYIKGVFEQTKTTKSPNRSMVSGGDFIIAAELGIVWITKYPAASITAMGQDFIIQSAGRKKSVMDAKGNDTYIYMAETMKSLFTGNSKNLEERFENYFFEQKIPSGKTWTLGLIPKEKALKEFAQQIILEGSNGENGTVIDKMIFIDKNGNSTAYAFSQQYYPADLDTNEKDYFSK